MVLVHPIRNSSRYHGRQHREAIVKSVNRVSTAVSEQATTDP